MHRTVLLLHFQLYMSITFILLYIWHLCQQTKKDKRKPFYFPAGLDPKKSLADNILARLEGDSHGGETAKRERGIGDMGEEGPQCSGDFISVSKSSPSQSQIHLHGHFT